MVTKWQAEGAFSSHGFPPLFSFSVCQALTTRVNSQRGKLNTSPLHSLGPSLPERALGNLMAPAKGPSPRSATLPFGSTGGQSDSNITLFVTLNVETEGFQDPAAAAELRFFFAK